MDRFGSVKQARSYLVTSMRAEGRSWVEIAEELRERHGVNARKAMRWAHSWSQADVAREWTRRWSSDPRTGQNVSTWECWPVSGHEPSLEVLTRLAEIYQCNVSDLVADVGCFRHCDDVTGWRATPLVAADSSGLAPVVPFYPEEDPMDPSRRHFAAAAVFATLGCAEPFRSLLTSRDLASPVVGSDHVAHLEDLIRQIEAHDAAVGGSDLLDTVDALHDQVAAWLQARSFATPAISDALQQIRGDLLQWAGWLAFDADQPRRARRHTEEALVHARLIDDPILEAQALNCMCQLLLVERRPTESLQAAEAAQRIARGWGTPRVAALFHLRAAHAHAALGEQRGFGAQMANAKTQLDQGPHADDPLFVHFVTDQEAASIEGLSYLSMERPDRAVAAFAAAAQGVDANRQRNRGYYTVWHAAAAARQRDIVRASHIGLDAVPLVAGLTSGRTTRLLASLRDHVEPHRRTAPIVRDFAAAYDESFA